MQSPDSQNETLVQCLGALCSNISRRVKDLGGDKLRKSFEDQVNTRIASLGEHVALNQGQLRNIDTNLDWTRYRRTLTEVIRHAREIVGDRAITAEIRRTVSDLERQSGTSLYETSYRLGILDHLQDR